MQSPQGLALRRERSQSIDLNKRSQDREEAGVEEMPAMTEDWKHLNRYRFTKQRIDTEYTRFAGLRVRALLVIFAGFILHVVTQNKIQNNTRVSTASLELFWQRIFMHGGREFGYNSNEKMMDQIFENLASVLRLQELMFTHVPTPDLRVSLRYINIDQEKTETYMIPMDVPFDRQNVTKALGLPLDLHDPRSFKAFFDQYDTLSIIVENLVVCYFKENVEGCYLNDLKIRYIRYGYMFYGRIVPHIRRGYQPTNLGSREVSPVFHRQFRAPFLRPKAVKKVLGEWSGRPKRHLLTKEALLGHVWEADPLPATPEPPQAQISEGQADHFDSNKLASFLLLVLAAAGLYLDLQVTHRIRLDHFLEKHFELKLIIFSQQKALKEQLAQSAPKPKELTPFLVLSVAKNALLVYYSLAFLLPSVVKISWGLTHLTQILSFLAVIEILSLRPDIGLILPVLRNSLGFFLTSFIGFFAMAGAIVLAGNLLINGPGFFDTPSQSFLTFYSLMTGDSVLLIFDSVRSQGWLASVALTLALIFFVFAFQSLYIMIVSDSFLSLIQIDAQEDIAQDTLDRDKPDNFVGRRMEPNPAFMELIVEERWDPLQTEEEKTERSVREISVNGPQQAPLDRISSLPRHSPPDEREWPKESPQPGEPANDTSSVYADSRENHDIGSPSPGRQTPAEGEDDSPLLPTQAVHGKRSLLSTQKMFNDEKDEIELFNNIHHDVQAQFKSMMNLEMELFAKIKKLLNASLGSMSNFDKMYVKLCMEFVQGHIAKQQTRVLDMRRSI